MFPQQPNKHKAQLLFHSDIIHYSSLKFAATPEASIPPLLRVVSLSPLETLHSSRPCPLGSKQGWQLLPHGVRHDHKHGTVQTEEREGRGEKAKRKGDQQQQGGSALMGQVTSNIRSFIKDEFENCSKTSKHAKEGFLVSKAHPSRHTFPHCGVPVVRCLCADVCVM